MSEFESQSHIDELTKKSEKPTQSETRNFEKTANKISKVKSAEEKDRFTDFLSENGFNVSDSNIQALQIHIDATKEFFPEYCLYDLTKPELQDILGEDQKTIRLEIHKEAQKSNELNQAQSAEKLVDQLQAQGVPNTQIIERLLDAHKSGEINLPSQQYRRYAQLLGTLSDNSLGSETKIVAQVIDTSSVDLTAPNAFDQIISEVLESDKLSDRAKEILREKFYLKPIVLGEDLRDNLIMQHARNAKISAEISRLSDRIAEFKGLIEVLERDIKRLEKEIKEEIDFTKRYTLEEELRHQRKLRDQLLTKRKRHNSERESLQKLPKPHTIYVRGCETLIEDNHIEIRIPNEERHLRFPLNSTSEAVAEQVNTFLLYRLFENYGIAADFFGNFDWTNRLLLLPDATSRANKLLHFLGMPGEAHILRDRKLKKLDKLMNRLMKPKKYDAKLSLEENGRKTLATLGMWPVDQTSTEKIVRKLRWQKYFHLN